MLAHIGQPLLRHAEEGVLNGLSQIANRPPDRNRDHQLRISQRELFELAHQWQTRRVDAKRPARKWDCPLP